MRKCTPREIIKEIPDVQTVVLPDQYWFDNLSDKQDVFSSLYGWMLENGRVPIENKETLHNRTYVGEKLFNRLIALEKKRLNKRYKIKGDELDREVSFSDINSGPKTEIGGCKISGEVILVVPESSRQALGEFSLKISRKERDVAINKIRANAAGATFYQWLLSQIDRDDRVGDVARDVAADEGFPRESNQYKEIELYLGVIGACSAAIESFKEGWLEYLQQYPGRVQSYAWCSECGQRIEVEDAVIAWSSESLGELFVLDAVCLNKYKGFDQMVSRPLSGVTHVGLEQLAGKEGISELEIEVLEQALKLWGVMPIVSDEGCVYFVRSEKTHAIKIGFTAGQVEDRLRALQTAHPYKLQVLATFCGSREYEKALHAQFANHRLEGEWFKPHPDLLTFISVLPAR